MEAPKDLGRRIVEASRLAVALHLQKVFGLDLQNTNADPDASAATRATAIASFNAGFRQIAKPEAE
jgi:hypothetical protein